MQIPGYISGESIELQGIRGHVEGMQYAYNLASRVTGEVGSNEIMCANYEEVVVMEQILN